MKNNCQTATPVFLVGRILFFIQTLDNINISNIIIILILWELLLITKEKIIQCKVLKLQNWTLFFYIQLNFVEKFQDY